MTNENKTDMKELRPELVEMMERQAFGLDENRPDAVAKRQQKNQKTARANVMAFCDADSFIEYGALAVAAQRGRRSEEDLVKRTPADGLKTGVGTVNGAWAKEANAMGGPVMIEGGGLGVFEPEEVDPIEVQGPNGAVIGFLLHVWRHKRETCIKGGHNYGESHRGHDLF